MARPVCHGRKKTQHAQLHFQINFEISPFIPYSSRRLVIMSRRPVRLMISKVAFRPSKCFGRPGRTIGHTAPYYILTL